MHGFTSAGRGVQRVSSSTRLSLLFLFSLPARHCLFGSERKGTERQTGKQKSNATQLRRAELKTFFFFLEKRKRGKTEQPGVREPAAGRAAGSCSLGSGRVGLCWFVLVLGKKPECLDRVGLCDVARERRTELITH